MHLRARPRFRAAALGVLASVVLLGGAAVRTQANPPKTLDENELEKVVEEVRKYFDLEEDIWRGRIAFRQQIETCGNDGYDLLGHMPTLRRLIYESRVFLPRFSESRYRRENEIDYKKLGNIENVQSDELKLAFVLPKSYPSSNKDFKRFPRPEPFPLLLSMIDKEDFTGNKYPGETLLKRRYPKDTYEELFKSWITLVPIAPAGAYTDPKGGIEREVFTKQYGRFMRHAHVDFERIILDGSDAALVAAAAQPWVFAGLVLRGGSVETSEQKALVKNFSPLPVFVVENETLAKQLTQAGHPNVICGPDADVMAWMQERRRVLPRKFSWNVVRNEHAFAWWLLAQKLGPSPRTLDVEVLDTEDDPNTIKINALNVSEIGIFLTDDVIDLSRPIRVLINGHEVFNKKVERNLDLMFNRDPWILRESMYFGFLSAARIFGLKVRPPAKEEAVPDEPEEPEKPAATPEEENSAARMMRKAELYIDSGKTDLAKKLLEKIIEMPLNAQTEKAAGMLAELKAASG